MTEKTIEKLLYEHIKNLDYHSARESKKGDVWKWNAPAMNEFIAFGENREYELRIRKLHKHELSALVKRYKENSKK